MNGPIPKSFVKGVAVHRSLARICTLHGVSYLKFTENVGYHIEGHAVFVEDGSETNNIIENNVVLQTI